MSEKHIQTPVCDDHPDDIACALCKYHKKLLCMSCALEKVKSAECFITEIRKISGEQDTALYEWLLMRRIASNKKRLIEEHEHKTEELKNKLKKQITDFHEELMTSLNKTKDDCLSSLEKYADRIITRHKRSKIQLVTFDRVIAVNVEKFSKFSENSSSDLNEIQTKLHEVKETLLTEVADVESYLEGNYQAENGLKDIVSKSGFILGKVYMISREHYDQLEHVTDSINNESTPKMVNDTEENNDFVHRRETAILSSDEVIYSRTLTGEGIETTEEGAAAEYPTQIPEEKSRNDNISPSPKKKRIYLSLFRRKKSHSKKQDNDTETDTNLHDIKDSPAKQNAAQNLTEDEYQDTSLHTQEYYQLKNLINKSVSIDGMQQHFRSACVFSKIVYLGSGYIGLLSKVHESVVLTSIDGKFHAKKSIRGVSDIVASGREQVAAITLVDMTVQVIKYRVGNRKFDLVGDFIVNAGVPRITGFDFDVASSTFAVSLPGRLITFKTAEVEREASYPIGSTSVSGEVVTSYDFRHDCLYLSDSQNKTLKCFSFARKGSLWKNRIDSQHKARNFCLYKETLCITYGNAIGLFNAKDGKAVLKHNTYDLLDDCDGICVIDTVIVFSSNSDDFKTSAKLAFINM